MYAVLPPLERRKPRSGASLYPRYVAAGIELRVRRVMLVGLLKVAVVLRPVMNAGIECFENIRAGTRTSGLFEFQKWNFRTTDVSMI